ncbi:MAG TPA: glycoside hydrolase family 30 protein [Puia sp.]|jgi:glucosylceramidase|nr:glycoside hydrolase family 30 protein [Puia sp.]
MKRYIFCSIFSILIHTAFAQNQKTVTVFTTAKNTTYRISKTDSGLKFSDFGQPLETQVCVFVDPTHSFQTILGIGGAITDASAETFAKMPANVQKQLLTAYYDKVNGIGYTLARTNIHSCDFSSESYTYVSDGDKELKSFNIDHDRQFRIPLIKQVIAVTGGKLTLFVSPWSPPAWMKDNNSMIQGGKLLPQYRQPWANYFVKFINAYQKEGIPVWGLTLQNEPMAKQTWESCYFSAEDERDFIKTYLGPTLVKQGMSDKKLIAWDHNRDLIYQRASTIFNDKEASKYIWGIGYHWYETWTGSAMMFDNVRRVAETFPDKKLMFTEGCTDRFDAARINEWALGEVYGHSMVNDFNNGTVGWTDWNILVDENGGPNHVGNFCFAPVIGDTKKGELIFTSSFYYIGHFSKFIRPGARRIISSSNRDMLETTAFENADGKIAVVVMNRSDKAVPYLLWMNNKAAKMESLPHSIATLIF